VGIPAHCNTRVTAFAVTTTAIVTFAPGMRRVRNMSNDFDEKPGMEAVPWDIVWLALELFNVQDISSKMPEKEVVASAACAASMRSPRDLCQS
jgi:hypothetical protein